MTANHEQGGNPRGLRVEPPFQAASIADLRTSKPRPENARPQDGKMAALLAEAHRYAKMRNADPYDRGVRERFADTELKLLGERLALGSAERGQHLLDILWEAFPTPAMSAAYFDNLERLLQGRKRRSDPGRVVLSLGSGRCGSTSLTAMLATIEGSCCTHENPPAIFWDPIEEQLAFHVRRLRLLAGFFSLVFDAAHWWLNVVDRFFASFPEGKIIGLFRDVDACVQSFMQVKGFGPGTINHWAPPANQVWPASLWDPNYPTYPLSADSARDPERAKANAIRRYVGAYNTRLQALAQRYPERVMVVRTEELNQATVQRGIYEFVGLPGRIGEIALNVGNVDDGKRAYRF